MLTMITNTVEGAIVFVPKDEINDIRANFVDTEKGKSFWRHYIDRFGHLFNRKYGADWRGPKKDPVYILEETKVWVQKQTGYF